MAKSWAQAFYTSKRWRNVRRQVLRRDLFACQICGARAEEVHHVIELTPENIDDPMIALDLDNLMSLCHECHTKVTSGYTGDVPEGFVFDDNGQIIPRPPR